MFSKLFQFLNRHNRESSYRSPTVSDEDTLVTAKARQYLRYRIELIEEIPSAHTDDIYFAALKCIQSGGRLDIFYRRLVSLNISNMDNARAKRTATKLWSATRAFMEGERLLSLGITDAIWMYSGAPCMVNPKYPTEADRKQDAAHRAAKNKRYSIADGLNINGELTWPGEHEGCRCSSRPFIPMFENIK